MNNDEIIEMAKQAGAIPVHEDPKNKALVGNKNIEAFAKMVAANVKEALTEQHMNDIWQAIKIEREACAIACEVHAATVMEPGSGTPWSACHECATAIRAKGGNNE